jgi:hypothetical protein
MGTLAQTSSGRRTDASSRRALEHAPRGTEIRPGVREFRAGRRRRPQLGIRLVASPIEPPRAI